MVIFCKDGEVLGLVLIQIPVEGGHEGGRLRVQNDDQRKVIDNHIDSDSTLYMTVILDRCHHRMEPLTRGSSLVFEFHLKWRNSHLNWIPQLHLAAFLSAFEEARKVLSYWNPDPVEGSAETSDDVKPNQIERGGNHQIRNEEENIDEEYLSAYESDDMDDSWDSDGSDDDFCNGDSECDFHLFHWCQYCRPVMPSFLMDILYFVLQGQYGKTIKFRDLEGQDREMALILQSFPFLEVVVGTVVRLKDSDDCDNSPCHCECHDENYVHINPFSKDCSCSACPKGNGLGDKFEIRGMVDLQDRPVDIALQLNWQKNYLGGGSSNLFENDSSTELKEFKILMFWPKRHSVKIFAHSTLMDRIESSTERRGEQLHELIDIWRRGSIFKTSSFNYSTWETARLLRLCTSLHAKEDGLQVLKVLGQRLGTDLLQNGRIIFITLQYISLFKKCR